MNMQNYTDSKFRIIQNQTKNDYFIICADDEVTQNEIKKRNIEPVIIPFGLGEPAGNSAGIHKDDQLIINLHQNQFSMSILELALQGKHNTYNSMAAGIASMIFEIRNEQLRESLVRFCWS
jgi:UDP-N-acetylmuramoylalanine--D-glutamate ligase